MKKAVFVNKPKFIKQYRGRDGLMKYSMDSALVFWTGRKQIVIKNMDYNGTFITNLASLPLWIHWLLKPDSKYLKYASALHDGLYDKKNLYKRVYADWTYLQALKVEGCPFVLRWVFFFGVRIFGSSYR